MFFCLLLLCLRARLFIDALWSPAWKGLTSLLSFVISNCEVVTFPFGILGQVWFLICLFLPISLLAALLLSANNICMHLGCLQGPTERRK